jgi:hypothetical protein
MPKDVKNEDRSGDMYENKGASDAMPDSKSGICAQLCINCVMIGDIWSDLSDPNASIA